MQAASITMATKSRLRTRPDQPRQAPSDHGADDEEAERAEAGRHREAGRTGSGEPDQDDVAGHVGREHVPETQVAHGIDEAADDGQGGQRHHQRQGSDDRARSSAFHLPRDRRRSRLRQGNGAAAGAGDRSPAVRERMPRVPAHQVTTRNLGAAYPFIAEAGLGQRGVVIGDDLLGGSFVFDPFELYAAGVVSNPNMVVFGQIGRGKSAFVKSFLWRQAVFGRRAWVVDPKGEYGDLADAWGVRPVALRPGGAIRLNPLDPGPDVDGEAAPDATGRRRMELLSSLGQRLSRPGAGAPRACRLGRGAGGGHPRHRGAHRPRGGRSPPDSEHRRGPLAAYRATRPPRGRTGRRAGTSPAGARRPLRHVRRTDHDRSRPVLPPRRARPLRARTRRPPWVS